MLYGKPTKSGTGITLFGDYNDLSSLYNTMEALNWEQKDQMEEQIGLVVCALTYELRHAIKGHRLIVNNHDENKCPITYYGFNIDWITLLYGISCLRSKASHHHNSFKDLINLDILEDTCRICMDSYDIEGAKFNKLYINAWLNVNDVLINVIHQKVLSEFSSMKKGKLRFRKIHSLICKHNTFSTEYAKLHRIYELEKKDNPEILKKMMFDYEYKELEW